MPPDPHESVTLWINDLRAGELAAASPLWQRHFEKLVHLARTTLARRRARRLMMKTWP